MPSLPALDFDSVRAALDPHLTEADLPNGVIALGIFAPAAWREVLRRDPMADTYTDVAKVESVKTAAEYLTAARLASTWQPPMVSERFAGGDYEYKSGVTWKGVDRASELRALAEAEFAAYLDPDGEVDFPIGFTLAHGCRGR